jgi:hypothetical protein
MNWAFTRREVYARQYKFESNVTVAVELLHGTADVSSFSSAAVSLPIASQSNIG